MALTNSQLAALKAGILAETDPSVVAALQNGADNVITAWCNQLSANPATAAWRVRVSPQDMDEAFLKAATKLDTLSAGKQFSLTRMSAYARDFNKQTIRNWLTDIWGNATANSDAEKILQALTETATKGQVYIGGTVRATGTVSALDRSFTGTFTDDDIAKALRG